MSLAKLKVFNQYTKGAMLLALAQQTDLFNAATAGAMTLVVKQNDGDFSDESFWKRIEGLIRRRDAYGAGAVAAVDLEQLQETSVKVAAGTPPVNIPPSRMKWILKSPEEQAAIYGRQLAEEMLADMVNLAIGATRAALVNVGASVVHDGTAADLSWLALNSGASKFGDRSSRIRAWVAHSKVVFDLWAGNLTNNQNLFMFGAVNVISDPWGRPIIMTDSTNLVDPTGIGAGIPSYFTLGLVPGGVMVNDNSDFEQNIETKNGAENITRTIQSEWSYNVAVKGFAWDKTNGGKSPSTAALTTGTNWDRVYTESVKDLAGVVVESK